ncbi:MAG TPA: ATP-binding protein, partial [Candidatus Limnocylindria bacterium]|nr:ATP-binding protein [Candidatus Limnocylindria bacterium]
DIPDIASIAVRTISEVLGCRAACLCFGEDGEPEGSFVQQRGPGEQVRREVADGAALKHRFESLRTGFDAGPEFHDWPIYGREAVLGVMRIPSATAEKMNAAQLRLLRSMIESTALAMDRYRSAQEQRRSREDILQERYRANLLRAISHDLRTPLASIMGTGEMLMGTLEPGDQRYRLAAEIYKDAGWLHSLVENILSLTRLRDGKIVLNKQTEAVEEVIGVAVNAIGKRAPGHEISVAAPEEVLLVPMDAKLIEQVLVNLLDNSVKHTPPGKEIKVSVREDREKGTAVFTVANRGPGIDPADLPRIFETFYTTRGKEPDARRGVGLGLAICETIVRAHGGTIAARAGEGGEGAEFVFTLPLEDKAHD